MYIFTERKHTWFTRLFGLKPRVSRYVVALPGYRVYRSGAVFTAQPEGTTPPPCFEPVENNVEADSLPAGLRRILFATGQLR